MRYFLSLFLTINLFAFSIDKIYKDTLDYIANSLKSLDIFLSDNNSTEFKQHFNIESSVEVVSETKKDIRFKFNIKANISLPRTKQKLNLFLQDYKKSQSIDENENASLRDSIQNTPLLLGIEYLTDTKIRYKAGIRFKSIVPDPFVNISWENSTAFSSNSWIYYGDRLFYYLKNHLDNELFLSYRYKIDDNSLLSFENSYRFLQRPILEHQVTHSLIDYISLDRSEILIPKIEIYFTKNSISGYRLNYIYGGASYQNIFLYRWLFFKVSAGAIFRQESDLGFRGSFAVGVRFQK